MSEMKQNFYWLAQKSFKASSQEIGFNRTDRVILNSDILSIKEFVMRNDVSSFLISFSNVFSNYLSPRGAIDNAITAKIFSSMSGVAIVEGSLELKNPAETALYLTATWVDWAKEAVIKNGIIDFSAPLQLWNSYVSDRAGQEISPQELKVLAYASQIATCPLFGQNFVEELLAQPIAQTISSVQLSLHHY